MTNPFESRFRFYSSLPCSRPTTTESQSSYIVTSPHPPVQQVDPGLSRPYQHDSPDLDLERMQSRSPSSSPPKAWSFAGGEKPYVDPETAPGAAEYVDNRDTSDSVRKRRSDASVISQRSVSSARSRSGTVSQHWWRLLSPSPIPVSGGPIATDDIGVPKTTPTREVSQASIASAQPNSKYTHRMRLRVATCADSRHRSFHYSPSPGAIFLSPTSHFSLWYQPPFKSVSQDRPQR